jgi:hypothetical protein
MTAVTALRRPDELLDHCVEAGGQNSFPGRATNPGDVESPIGRAPWFPRTPVETTMVYRRRW